MAILNFRNGLGYGGMTQRADPLKVAMAAAEKTQEPLPDETVEPRLSILDLESRIIEAQNAKVLLRTEFLKVEDRERELQTELIRRVQALGIKAAIP